MGTCVGKLLYDAGYGLSNSGDLTEPVFFN